MSSIMKEVLDGIENRIFVHNKAEGKTDAPEFIDEEQTFIEARENLIKALVDLALEETEVH